MDSPPLRYTTRRIIRRLFEADTKLFDASEVAADFFDDKLVTEYFEPGCLSQLDESIIAEDWVQLPDISSPSSSSPPVFHRLSKDRLKHNLSKFKKLLSRPRLNIDELKELSKLGVPAEVRAIVWKLLLGYLPLRKDKRRETVNWRRQRYTQFVKTHLDNGVAPQFQTVMRDIEADVPRTFPRGLISLFEKSYMREMLRRLLFIYAAQHPKKGYWQGLNDLFVPFIVVFLAWSQGCPISELNDLSNEELETLLKNYNIEPDVYWCTCFFLRNIQHNYVIRTPEIDVQTSFDKMRTLLAFKDPALLRHMDDLGVDFVFFGCRWLICMLIRELSLDNLARLWDSYFTYGDSLFVFHTYFCVAYLQSFSKQLLQCDDVASAVALLNNPPTASWTHTKLESVLRSVDDLVKGEKVTNLTITTITMLLAVGVSVLLLATLALYANFLQTLQKIANQQRQAALLLSGEVLQVD